MAITRFTQASGSYNPTAFKDFLDANKAGTFLADATITAHEPQSTIPYLSIALGDASFTIRFLSATSASSSVAVFLTFNSASGLSAGVPQTETSSAKTRRRLHGAMLCKNGLIMSVEHLTSDGSAISGYSYITLTADSDGALTLVRKNASDDYHLWYDAVTAYYAASYNSTAACVFGAPPQFEANRTAFSNITVIGSDNSLYLPSAYIASSTQLTGVAVQAVSIDGAAYITDGIVYIRDN